MPFKKGHTYRPVVKKISDSVTDETNESALNGDELIPKAPPQPTPEEVDSQDITAIPTTNDVDFGGIYGWNMAELEFMDVNLNRVPAPPKCVIEWCKARDLRWRWLSYPSVKRFGMRGHVALSLTPELRKKIKQGDCPPTVDIDVSNKLVWREDAFLGVIPVRLANLFKSALEKKTMDQTKLAQAAPGGLRELAARAGGKIVEYSVEETSRQGL